MSVLFLFATIKRKRMYRKLGLASLPVRDVVGVSNIRWLLGTVVKERSKNNEYS